MLETSKDILNFSLAVSVFGLSFLIGWMLVYFLLIIKRVVQILSELEKTMNKVGTFVETARDKLEHSASYLSLIATGAKELVNYLVGRQKNKSSSRK